MATIRERYVAVAASVALAGSIGIAASANVAAAAPSIAPSVAAASAPSAPSAKRLTTKKVNYCSTLTKKQRTTLKKQLRAKRLTNKQCSAKARSLKITAQKAAAKKPAPTPTPAPAPAPTPAVFGMSANGETALKAAETAIGLKAGVVGVFADFKHEFPAQDAAYAAARGASLMISWEPWDWEVKSQTQPAYTLDQVAAGTYDTYIRTFAQAAAATARPVFIRFAAEMNGDWQVWSTGANSNGPGDYIAAYRHVVDVSRAAGGTNIKWVFNPIVSYEGSTPLTQLYPGDSYVDWVALDGYNWGALKWGWQSFTDVFTMGLKEIKAIAPGKPLAIAEIGCTPGTGKAAWVTDSFAKAQAAGARMLVWFEHNKETDWRLSSDAQVAAAAKTAATQPGWVSGGDYNKVKAALGL